MASCVMTMVLERRERLRKRVTMRAHLNVIRASALRTAEMGFGRAGLSFLSSRGEMLLYKQGRPLAEDRSTLTRPFEERVGILGQEEVTGR